MRCAVAFAAVVLSAAPSAAQPTDAPAAPTSPEDPARMAQARERFRSGHDHYEQRRYREAIRDFELASSLYPSAEISYNIALCYEQLQEYDVAIEYFQRYLREKVDPPDRGEVEAKIAELGRLREVVRQSRRQRSGVGLLRIVGASARPGWTVSIDGGAPVRPAEPAPLPVGRSSRLVAEGRGMQRFVARVGAHPGEVGTALVQLEPATEYRTRHAARVWTWVVGGAALAAVGVGSFFGIRSIGRSADASAAWDAGECAPSRDCYADAAADVDRADWAFGAALILGVGAGILWFVEGASSETERVTAAGP